MQAVNYHGIVSLAHVQQGYFVPEGARFAALACINDLDCGSPVVVPWADTHVGASAWWVRKRICMKTCQQRSLMCFFRFWHALVLSRRNALILGTWCSCVSTRDSFIAPLHWCSRSQMLAECTKHIRIQSHTVREEGHERELNIEGH